MKQTRLLCLMYEPARFTSKTCNPQKVSRHCYMRNKKFSKESQKVSDKAHIIVCLVYK